MKVLKAVRLLIQAIVLFLCFSVNLTVKAGEEEANDTSSMYGEITLEPLDCLSQQTVVCGVKTKAKPARFVLPGLEVHLGAEAILIRTGPDSWYLSQGSVWVKSVESLDFKSKFGSVSGTPELNVLLSLSEDGGVVVLPLEEDAVVLPKNSSNSLSLKVGMIGEFKGLATSGEGLYEIPQAANPKQVIKKWSELYLDSPQNFMHKISEYNVKWQSAVQRVSHIHKYNYQRTVAAAEAKENAKQARRRRYREESQRLRKMFREKTYY